MNANDEGLMMRTELGLEVEEAPVVMAWRVHTGERFERDHREVAEFMVGLYRGGVVSVTAIADLAGPLCGRNTTEEKKALHSIIRGLIRRKIPAEERKAIIVAEGLATVSEGIVKAREMIEACGADETKHLGSVSIAVKSINEVLQLHSGGPTRISGKVQEGGVSAFEKFRQKAREKVKVREVGPVVEVLPEKVTEEVGVVEAVGEKEGENLARE
jgi:hypothetical protein